VQAVRESLILAEIDAGEARPSDSGEQTSQREQMVVLSFIPHAVAPISADQMCDEPCLAFDGALRELLVLEPDGGSRQCCVVPICRFENPSS